MPAAPKYQQLADHVIQAIAQGALRPGQRLPSLRDWARQFGVSHNTALQAMRTLEDAHWVQPRNRSGFYVRAAREGTPNAASQLDAALMQPRTVTVDWYAHRLLGAQSSDGVTTFGSGTPDMAMLSPERVRQALHKAVSQHGATLCVYPHANEAGQPELQQALARFALELGCVLPPQEIVVTQGCIDAMTCGLRAVTQAGDLVALESPAHFSFLELLQSLNLRALEIPTDQSTGMSLDALQLALETHPVKAVLIVPTLQNPLGSCMPQTHRKRLANMASQHDVAILEDAVYNEWAPLESQRRAVKAHDQTGHVMLCHSFTKTLAPGLRLGWLHAGRWTDAVLAIRNKQMGPPTEVLQLALAQLIGQGHAAFMRRFRKAAGARLREARGLVTQHFPKGTRVSNPAGGLLLWLQLPSTIDCPLFEQRCKAAGLLAPPGRYFSLSGRYADCYRIALGAWTDAHRRGLAHMGELAASSLRG